MYLFDFDGVLINSVKEAMLSAFNAVNQTKLTKIEEMPKGCYDLFIKNVFHFYTPYTLYCLIKWCGENYQNSPDMVLSRAEYKSYLDSQDLDPKKISPYFYSIRTNFMESNPKEWLDLNEPYFLFWNKLIEIGAKNVFILTAKNRSAVLKLCWHYGLEIPDENIFSGDNNVSKIENFKIIRAKFNAKKFYFVDDHLSNLKDLDIAFNQPDNKVIDLILCNWGYGDQDDFEKAKALGYEVLSQEELISRV